MTTGYLRLYAGQTGKRLAILFLLRFTSLHRMRQHIYKRNPCGIIKLLRRNRKKFSYGTARAGDQSYIKGDS